jgi:ubiquinone/menaquinone biosynthesis C-methylase UbiE
MKLYDKKNERLIIFKEKATPEFWDRHWQVSDFIKKVRSGENNLIIKSFTKKFLKPGSKILEGGCGTGKIVYGLKNWGYDAYGVDFAKETIKKIKENFPELKVFVQDVRKLDFSDNFFDGYWSLGVIEHFWEGYNEILKEAKRVVKPEGFLFLTFPWMSPLRKFKAKRGLYKTLARERIDGNNFYQFILDEKKVIRDLRENGFELIQRYPSDATKGLKDEFFFLKPVLQRIYNCQNIIAKGIRFLISILFSKIAGHTILLVFKNEKAL